MTSDPTGRVAIWHRATERKFTPLCGTDPCSCTHIEAMVNCPKCLELMRAATLAAQCERLDAEDAMASIAGITVEEMCRELLKQAIADGIIAGPWIRCSAGDLTGMANLLNGYLGQRSAVNRWAAGELRQAFDQRPIDAMGPWDVIANVLAALESGTLPDPSPDVPLIDKFRALADAAGLCVPDPPKFRDHGGES